MTTEETYGLRLRAARTPTGLSHEKAATRVHDILGRDVSSKTISRLENGTTSEDGADASLVMALCQVYGVDPDLISVPITERALREKRLYNDVIPRYAHLGSDLPVGDVLDEICAA